ncbi:MAG: hypothetical protein ACKVZH_09860 [Blastocatellia bacterium]
MNHSTQEPQLSVIVAIIAGGSVAMSNCLTALEPGALELGAECIVPFDDRLDGVEQLAARFGWVRFVDARSKVDSKRFGDFSREHHDILRAIGLNQATGKIVALLEDHAAPSPGWCRAMLDAHRGTEAAIGGAVENGVDRLLNWAVYLCDFGRYQNPVPTGPAEFLSDSNISYKRQTLEQVRDLWQDAFHETPLNWELRKRGELLRLDPGMVVYQARYGLRMMPALRERFVWGRSFAGTRAKAMSLAQRGVFCGLSFLLPALLTLRIVRLALSKRRHLNRIIPALPLVALLQCLWSLGELAGYITGRTGGPEHVL